MSKQARYRRRRNRKRGFKFITLLIICLAMIIPLYWLMTYAFKDMARLF